MHANNLIFCRKMMDKAAKKQSSVGFLDPVYFNKYFSAFSASWQSNLRCNDGQLLRGGYLLH
jgi:hypothetical protein